MLKRSCTVLLCMLLMPMGWAGASVQDERKIQLGLNLFPNIISVDQNVLSKTTADGTIRLLLVYETDLNLAERLAKNLAAHVKTIRKVVIDLKVVKSTDLDQKQYAHAAGMFVTEKLSNASFLQVNHFAMSKKIVLFSPFSGDVERGASVGLSISSKILPYYNAQTLSQSGIVFHPVFLKVAKRYEP